MSSLFCGPAFIFTLLTPFSFFVFFLFLHLFLSSPLSLFPPNLLRPQNEAKGLWQGDIADSLAPSNVNYFRVKWENGEYPSDEASCNGGSASHCVWDAEFNACICEVTVDEGGVFQGNEPPFYYDALSQLSLESPSPVGRGCIEIDASTVDVEGNTVSVWDCTLQRMGILHESTVFELQKAGSSETKYLKNAGSTVRIDTGSTTSYSFQNPPHLVGFAEQDARDVEYELDLVLDQYFYHSNTAPFLASRLIQRFGISNPSPRYVKVVATAFTAGTYQTSTSADAPMFGSGEYGDLAATLAAILLDPEARSPVLDADPSFGGLREPVLKVIHLLRAMEFEPVNKENFKMIGVSGKIGQWAHSVPSVFSFFLPDFVPPGRANEASLVSPEGGMTNTPTVLALLEGMFSLIKYGLSECYGGFGDDTPGSCSTYPEEKTATSPKALGRLMYEPTEGVDMIDEMALILTAGRLKDPALLHYMYELGLGAYDDAGSMRIAQQLMVSAPEFHTNTLVKRTTERVPKGLSAPSSKPYKAIVYFFQSGGMDSYNIIVPDPEDCPELYANYTATRGEAALTSAELGGKVTTGSSQATCNSFRFHQSLPFVESLFRDEKEVAVLANTGVLLGPVTQDNWKDVHAKTNLFAHDVQQRESKYMDPFQDKAGTGVLGRMNDVLSELADPFQTGQLSLEGNGEVVAGEGDGFTNFVSSKGASPFDPDPSIPRLHRAMVGSINNQTQYGSSVFGELWSSRVVQAIEENGDFYEAMQDVELVNGEFPSSGSTSDKLQEIAKLIKGHDARGTDRDVFYLKNGGWDTHDNMKERLVSNFGRVNSVLEDFVTELKAQDVWNDVLVVVASDFGRTLSMNSRDGTDHAWAGNYLVLGGDVKGGVMHGTYPEDYEAVSVGRSRLHPTTPWEAVWKGAAEWFGVPADKMGQVLPNLEVFDDTMLLSASAMFKSSGAAAPASAGEPPAERRKNIRA
jgi:uncharacterized protein (DUF1501 family)